MNYVIPFTNKFYRCMILLLINLDVKEVFLKLEYATPSHINFIDNGVI